MLIKPVIPNNKGQDYYAVASYNLKVLTSLNKLSPQVTSSSKEPKSIDAEAHAYFHIVIFLT